MHMKDFFFWVLPCAVCKSVMSHTWMSPASHTHESRHIHNESCHMCYTTRHLLSHFSKWMSHTARINEQTMYMNESYHAHTWVLSHTTSHVTRTNESGHMCYTPAYLHSRFNTSKWMSHTAHINKNTMHMNESCHTHIYKQVMWYTQTSHFSDSNESCPFY